jgi:hypothetical protein
MIKTLKNLMIVTCIFLALADHAKASKVQYKTQESATFFFLPDGSDDEIPLTTVENFCKVTVLDRDVLDLKEGNIKRIELRILFASETSGWIYFMDSGKRFNFYVTNATDYNGNEQYLRLLSVTLYEVPVTDGLIQKLIDREAVFEDVQEYVDNNYDVEKVLIEETPLPLPFYKDNLPYPMSKLTNIYFNNMTLYNMLGSPTFEMPSENYFDFKELKKKTNKEDQSDRANFRREMQHQYVSACIIYSVKSYEADKSLPASDVEDLKKSLYSIFEFEYKDVLTFNKYFEGMKAAVDPAQVITELNDIVSKKNDNLIMRIADTKFSHTDNQSPIFLEPLNLNLSEMFTLPNFYKFLFVTLFSFTDSEPNPVSFEFKNVRKKITKIITENESFEQKDLALSWVNDICERIEMFINWAFSPKYIQTMFVLEQVPGFNEYFKKYLTETTNDTNYRISIVEDDMITVERINQFKVHWNDIMADSVGSDERIDRVSYHAFEVNLDRRRRRLLML